MHAFYAAVLLRNRKRFASTVEVAEESEQQYSEYQVGRRHFGRLVSEISRFVGELPWVARLVESSDVAAQVQLLIKKSHHSLTMAR